MIENWIKENLINHKNCLIPKSLYKQLGKEGLIEELRKEGLECEIEERNVSEQKQENWCTRSKKSKIIIATLKI